MPCPLSPPRVRRKATDMIGGISMGYFISQKARTTPPSVTPPWPFVEHMTSDAVLSTFVTTEVTALKNGATLRPELPAAVRRRRQRLRHRGQRRAGHITSEAKTDLFANVQNVVTGNMDPREAIVSAIALN